MKGRKRHIAVDSSGLLLAVVVHAANLQDRVSAKRVLRRVRFSPRWTRLVLDGGYDSPALAHWCRQLFGVQVDFVKRVAGEGFSILPSRWVVERTFAWLGKCRRLSKDYEVLPAVSETFVQLAMIHLMTRRLARNL